MKRFLRSQFILFVFFMSVAAVLVTSIVATQIIRQSAQMIQDTSSFKMLALSRAAALLATADELDEYMTPQDMDKEGYLDLKEKLIAFTKESGHAYTYYLRLDTETNMMQFIIDNVETDYTGLNEPQVAREETPDIALSGTACAVPFGSYSTGWNDYLTAFAPVYYEDGTLSNIVAGVDMEDSTIKDTQNNLLRISLVFVFSLFFVLASCLASLLLYRAKARQAQVASVSKSSFLSNMSHEMRTPLNAIIGMTEIAKSSEDPQRMQYCLTKIDDAAAHLLGVINDVLDISKIEAGKFTLSPSEFSVEEMISRVVNVIHFKLDEKHQNFVIKLDPHVPDYILSDQQRLAQVITNLLSNAVKFTPNEGTITLDIKKLSEAGSEVTLRVEVSDTGIGINPEQQARLFSSFEQADNSISRRFGGTGLGLAISKSIVEMMGGSIGVTSTLGQGACFAFTVRVKGCVAPAQSRYVLKPGIEPHDLHLMIVDDAPDVLEYFSEIAARFGFSCLCASGGEEALALLRERSEPCHLYFVDYQMPGMNGVDFVRQLNALYDTPPTVIMVSAYQWGQIEEDAKAAGISRYLAKPLLPSSIVNCINECLGADAYGGLTARDADSKAGIFQGKRILLAEDIEINREIAGALLADTGVLLTYAENGARAVELFASDPGGFDLIFMDIHMPDMDGYQATQAIRALPVSEASTIPIIAMTANVFREDVERCLSVGMNDHVGKPIDIDEMIEKISAYLLLPLA